MIDKTALRDTLLALTSAEMAQAHKTYERFLAAAKLDASEPIDSDEQSQAQAAAELAEAFDDQEHAAEAKLAALQTIDFGSKTQVEPGAVLRFGERYLVIGVSTGEFTCQGKTFVGISPAAPVYAALEGKQKGDECAFRGRDLHIHELY